MDVKLRKKIARSLGLLRRHEPDVVVSDTPTKILYVANAGVVCGVQWHHLASIFCQFGTVDTIHVLSNAKPYVFVVYDTVESAESAVCALQGAHPSCIPSDTVVFYLAFLQQLPDSINHRQPVPLPDGLHLLKDFVDVDSETDLIEFVDSLPEPIEAGEGSTLRSRRVHHFGYEFDYSNNQVNFDSHTPAMPARLELLIDRIMDTGHVVQRPDQCTINIYQSGQGIASHVDTHSAFEDAIISLSLADQVVIDFKPMSVTSNDSQPVLVPARSLLVMTGASRYAYKHGIAARKHDALPDTGELHTRRTRYSLTFRAVRRQPCQCDFPQHCDHVRGSSALASGSTPRLPETDLDALTLERSYVTQVYDTIAHHFDVTRHSQWRGIKEFLDGLNAGDCLLDVGCGNGKYLVPDERQLVKIGCDMCLSLCAIARDKSCHVSTGDCLYVPYADGRFDAVICVAVIHHMATQERRRRAVSELMRVLRPGGRAMITVWAYEQKSKTGDKSEYIKWGEKKTDEAVAGDTSSLAVHVNLTPFKQQDLLVPWQVQKTGKQEKVDDTQLRFYHVFKEGELEELCSSVENCKVDRVYYEQGNWCALLSKL